MDNTFLHQEEKVTEKRIPQEPAFVKMYIENFCAIVGVNDSDQALLRHLLVRLGCDGYVALTARIRASICESLEIAP